MMGCFAKVHPEQHDDVEEGAASVFAYARKEDRAAKKTAAVKRTVRRRRKSSAKVRVACVGSTGLAATK